MSRGKNEKRWNRKCLGIKDLARSRRRAGAKPLWGKDLGFLAFLS
jgi:hypothetical protein